MDFGGLDGLFSSQNNKSSLISCGDLGVKPKWFGSGGGFCKQETSVTPVHQDEWRDLKMAKIGEDDIAKAMLFQQQRSNQTQNMLSFSPPNTHSVAFPYYARNNTGYGSGGPFTPSQWMELEHQALIYKYIDAKAAIPSNLLMPIKKAIESAAFSAYSAAHLRHHDSFGWGALHLGFRNSADPEPGRCRRTDGKKWRCAKDAVPDQKYCERHMNRGRHRSRKHVEAQSCHSIPSAVAAKLTSTTTTTTTRHPNPPPAASSQDNRSFVNKATMAVTVGPISSIDIKKNQTREEDSCRAEFGIVCSNSLLNPMHKNDLKSPNPLHQFMEDWPHSNQSEMPASMSSTPSPSLSPLRICLGMGGPLGEVLHHSTNNSPSGLNLMTEGWAPETSSQKVSLGHLL